MLVLIVTMLAFSAAAHTGNNHTLEQLESEEHSESEEFAFVSEDYPEQTSEFVIGFVAVVAVLFVYSIHHYRKTS